MMIFFAATGLAVIILRRKRANLNRAYKVWGYPVVPLFFVGINIIVLANTLWSQPVQSAIGLSILGMGIPYYLWKKKPGRIRMAGEHKGEQG